MACLLQIHCRQQPWLGHSGVHRHSGRVERAARCSLRRRSGHWLLLSLRLLLDIVWPGALALDLVCMFLDGCAWGLLPANTLQALAPTSPPLSLRCPQAGLSVFTLVQDCFEHMSFSCLHLRVPCPAACSHAFVAAGISGAASTKALEHAEQGCGPCLHLRVTCPAACSHAFVAAGISGACIDKSAGTC